MKTTLLLVTGVLLLVMVVAWRPSSDEAIAAPAPLELKAAAPPAVPAEKKKDATVSAAAKVTAPAKVAASAKKAVSDETPDDYVYVPTKPAASNSTRKAVVETSASRPAASVSAPAYERRVAEAASLSVEEPSRAIQTLEQLSANAPNRPEAYEALATIRLRQWKFRDAAELYGMSLSNGGKATFTVIHDHTRGNFDHTDAKATCVGELTILANEIRFEGSGDAHRFAASWTDVLESGSNRFFGSGIGGFHVALSDDGKYRNFNLAPLSKDKLEGRLILDLLASKTRREDRGSK